jgi:DNA-binding CsgD family transcriptional regulator
MSDKQVARALGISDQTARKHRAHLLDKTAAANICALLHTAVLSGWLTEAVSVPPPDSR